MAHYIITIQNDMVQQLIFSAESVTEALEKAKQTFTEEMITGTESDIESSSTINVKQHSKRYEFWKVQDCIPIVTKAEKQAQERIRIEDIPD